MIDQFDNVLDQVEGAVGEGGLSGIIGGGNVILDPAPEVNSVISAIFVAMIEFFSIFKKLLSF